MDNNSLTFDGKITWVGKRIDGISATSGKTWCMLQVEITEEKEQYPQKLIGTIFGEDKIAAMMPTDGEKVTAYLSLDARRYQDKNGVERGRSDIRIWKLVRPIGNNITNTDTTNQSDKAPDLQPTKDGDLPF